MQVPSWLSVQLMSAFEGPSMARERPPDKHHTISTQAQFCYPQMFHKQVKRVWEQKYYCTFSSILGVNCENCRLIDHPMNETRAISSHMTTVDIIHIELQWASCKGNKNQLGVGPGYFSECTCLVCMSYLECVFHHI